MTGAFGGEHQLAPGSEGQQAQEVRHQWGRVRKEVSWREEIHGKHLRLSSGVQARTQSLGRARPLRDLRTAACQAPLSTALSWQRPGVEFATDLLQLGCIVSRLFSEL